MAPKRSLAAARGSALIPLSIIERASQDAPYGRVSSLIQREEQTIETQKDLLIGDITSRDPAISGRDIPVSQQRKLVAQFWDDGVSGTVPFEQRPEGRRLIATICRYASMSCKGDCGGTGLVIDTVWVTKLDRLARQLQILIEIEAFFRAHGVGLRCLDYDINTKTSTGTLIFTILGAIAQWEREIILERTAGGKRTKASEGKYMGGRRTLGLKTDENGYLVVDDALVGKTGRMAYQVVKEIFDNVIEGSSIDREADRFGLTPRIVGGILHNPRYKGQGGMFQGGKWIEAERNAPPQIVSPETWDLAQQKLLENRRLSSRNRKYEYLVAQIMKCCQPKQPAGQCGRIFVGRIVRGKLHGPKYTYYSCYREGCTARPMRGSTVEAAVWTEVRQRLIDPESFLNDALARGNQTEKVRELRMELTVTLDQLSKLDSERLSVLRNIDKKHYTEAEGEARLKEISDTHADLADQRSTLEIQLRSATLSRANLRRAGLVSTDIGPELDHIEALAQSNDPDESHRGRARQRALIKQLLDRIEVRVHPSGRIRLRLFWSYEEDAQDLSIDLTTSAQAYGTQQQIEPILIVTEIDLAKGVA
jgi:site-specific DNA recombinase